MRASLLAPLLVAAVSPAVRGDDLWLHLEGNGVPGTLVFALDGAPDRPYAIVVSGFLQEQAVLGVQVHVGLELLPLSSVVPGLLGTLDGAGNATVGVPVPNAPEIVGSALYAQAFLLGPLDSWSNWCSVLFESAPGSGPGSGFPRFAHRQGGIVHDAWFRDAANGWTAEDGGRVRVTHDGGATWSFQRTPDSARAQLRGIFFLDLDRGWAVGDSGLVIRTTNGGCLWTRVLSVPTSADLYRAHFATPTQGWIVGKEGTLLASTDGGETWSSQAPSCLGVEDLYGVAFTSPMDGVAVGDQAVVFRTTDAGQTWTSVPNPHNPTGSCPQPGHEFVEWWDVEFASPSIGWVTGGIGTGEGRAIVTTDGGQSWTATTFCGGASPATLYGVAALEPSGALAVGYGSQTFVASSPSSCFADHTQAGFASPPLFGASAAGPLLAWSVGMFDAIRKTTDGGLSWQNLAGSSSLRLNDVHFADDSTGWVAGQGFGIAKTTDGGFTWQPQHSQTTGLFALGISFADAQRGCAVGQGGFVRYTTNGGASWLAPASIPTTADLADVTFASSSAVWAVGAAGTVLRSLDGGAHWTGTSLAGAPDLEAVAFGGAQTGLAVGASGAAFLFANGAWSRIPTGTTTALHAVAAVSPVLAYAAGDGGIVLRYDGVAFTRAYASPSGLALHAIEALPGGEVFAVGDEGLFVRFDSSGVSEPKSSTSVPLRGLSFLSPTSGYAVGRSFLLLRYEPE